jgi:HPt (histidine-containing phosphotransfer) domain-containing protein
MHAGTTAELVFDRAQALESLGGDEELLANVASLFVDEAVSYRQALTLQREAHTVKSVLATFAYEAGRERALRLEQLAASGNLEAAKAATDEVIAALQTLSEVLKAPETEAAC